MDSLLNGGILIIDSNPVTGSGMRELLVGHGYLVGWARDEYSAIETACQMHLDLIICGEWIARELGLKIVGRLLKKRRFRRTAVILCSQSQSAGVILRNHDFGSAMHLKQPIDSAVLVQLVEQLTGLPRSAMPSELSFPVHATAGVVESGLSQSLAMPN